MAVKSELYPRKRSKVGSFDSICLTCFATYGCCPGGKSPEHVKNHVCDSAFLAERGILTRREPAGKTAPYRPSAQAL